MITCNFEDGVKTSLRHVVVHLLVEKDNKLLLVKRASHLLEGGKWGIPSGFLDRNETASEGALRELLEETGWQGEIISLFRINSNSYRPNDKDRQSVALEFIVKPIKEVSFPDSESSEVKWWPIEELGACNFAFDHGETIKLYLQYRQNPFVLPVLI